MLVRLFVGTKLVVAKRVLLMFLGGQFMRTDRHLFVVMIACCGLFAASTTHAARILNPEVESQLDQKQQLIKFDLLFDPGEKAVALEVYALEFKDGATPPLSPIA